MAARFSCCACANAVKEKANIIKTSLRPIGFPLRKGRALVLAATLWLSRKDRRRLRFDSDDHGRFSGVLPEEGLWIPQIQSETEKLSLFLEPVEIKPPQGKNLATVEIHVPDTKLSGQVVDEEGQPVPVAHLILLTMEPWRSLRATQHTANLGAHAGERVFRRQPARPHQRRGRTLNLCMGAAAVSRLKQGGEPPAASCTSGVLAPSGELVLRAPASVAGK